MGPNLSHVLTLPEIPEVWLVLTSTNLTRTRVIELEEVGFCLHPTCPFPLDNFSPRLGYFNMFCGLILDQHMPKESLLYGMANKFVKVVRHPPKIITISERMQGI